ncbi:DUF6712 family protein [Spirosoma sordidisoli]|uniref:Uncharacterized protein n=1 Tax=Spirosoma sordidisoli TaxID=2502893 RepID=A0A4Q2UKE3_9BACT|nr:DUF6712 family protein [Spirosoma sordidisoli]RYC69754.1 hypothetical protein EQG79_14255 [Spirosoma sordidisoli]
MTLLIRTIQELAEVVTFSGDIRYESLKPALRSSQAYLATFVGDELLEELGADQLDEDQAALLPYLTAAIGNLAMLRFVAANNVRITDVGNQRNRDANSSDAFEWQLERTMVSLETEAYAAIESLLRYLAGHLETFPAYATSAPYLQEKSQLIGSAELFNQYYSIGSSRLVLITLLPSMRTAERSIRKMLGEQLEGLLGDDLSPEQTELLDSARRALVYATIARALRERLVTISEKGVQVCGISQVANLHWKSPASDKQLQQSIQYFDEQAAQFTGELATLITPTTPADPTTIVGRVRGTSIVSL